MLTICSLRPEEKREVPEHYPYPDLKAPFSRPSSAGSFRPWRKVRAQDQGRKLARLLYRMLR